MSTLLDDLDNTACYHESRAHEDPENAGGHRNLADRLRAAAARLREEMARADTRWTENTSTVVRDLMERINGGPP